MTERFPTAHRPYPPPKSAWIMAQSWHDVLFAHWTVPVDNVKRALPRQLPLDTYDGQAWISIVAFNVKGFRPRGLPPIPRLSYFPQINVRTYVTLDGKLGIYTFSLDVNNPLAVIGAQSVFYLPYFLADVKLIEQGSRFRFTSKRKGGAQNAVFDAYYASTAEAVPNDHGSLAYWLAERYCLYSVDKTERVYRTEIHHPPWPLQVAEVDIQTNTLTTAAGISSPESAPLFHYAGRQDVILWFRHRL